MQTLRERFDAKVSTAPHARGCMEWTAATTGKGYGVIYRSGKMTYAHRLAYEFEYGQVPAGLVVRHKCDNPPCVNPEHLLLGTQADNMRDMWERGRGTQGDHAAAKTHCPAGHEYTPENTYRFPSDGGRRRCAACRRAAIALVRAERVADADGGAIREAA